MHRSNWRYSEVEDPPLKSTRSAPWENQLPNTTGARCTSGYQNSMGSNSFIRRPSRKQYLCHLLAEFEKCAQQSEDILTLRKEWEKVKRGVDEIHCKIEDISFESKITADKLKFLSKDLQELKRSHLQLRDEASKEFRKTYKRMATIEKDVDLMKYRQTMAAKKHILDLEALKWELNPSNMHHSSVYPPSMDLDCLKRSVNGSKNPV